jgi:hypothetical protein
LLLHTEAKLEAWLARTAMGRTRPVRSCVFRKRRAALAVRLKRAEQSKERDREWYTSLASIISWAWEEAWISGLRAAHDSFERRMHHVDQLNAEIKQLEWRHCLRGALEEHCIPELAAIVGEYLVGAGNAR